MNSISKIMRRGLPLLGVFPTLVLSVTVNAQDTGPDTLLDEEPGLMLEEVIVTATKRSESLRELPLAISAFNNKAITDRDIKTVSDLQTQVPNMTVGGSGVTLMAIRGVGFNNALGIGEPGVAMHVDGVYLSRPTMQTLGFEDLQRIEVLRGPQGTLYGRNATAGVVNIVSKSPEIEPAAEVSVLVGNYDQQSTRGFITGALGKGEKLLGRLTWLYGERDSYWEDAITGDTAFRDKNWGLNSKISYETDSSLMINATVFYRRDESSEFAAGSMSPPLAEFPGNQNGGDPTPTPTVGFLNGLNDPGVNTTTKRFKLQNTAEYFSKNTTKGAILSVEKEFNDFSVRSTTGYIDHNTQMQRELDGTDVNLILQDNDDDTKSLSQELIFFGDFEDGDWLFGFYALNDKYEPFTHANFPIGLTAPPGLLFPNSPTLTVPPTSLANPNTEDKTKSYAAFVNANYDVTESITLNAGLRYTHDEKDFTQTYGLSDLFGQPLWLCEDLESNANWSEFTPKLGIKYQIDEQMMIFANLSRGYKAGGFNTSACADEFDPEYLNSFELGLKASFLDNTLQLNVAAFYYDYEDLQMFKQVGVQAFVENASSADIFGLEADGQWILSEAFLVDITAAYLDATYGDFSGVDELDPNGGDPVTHLVDLKGNRLNRSPEWSGSLGLNYVKRFEAFQMTTRAEYAYKGSMYFNEFNRDNVKESSYSLLNLYVILEAEKLSTRFFVKNLNDTEYANSMTALGFTGGVGGSFGAPRTYGVELSYRF